MRFHLIDRIVEVRPGQTLQAIKNLTLGEEYLADHFPSFPVMPGVLMLQTLVEAGAWLLRLSEDYRHSVIVLREVKNIKYGTFMEPGRRMNVSVELVERSEGLASFKGKGEMDGQPTVTARLVLASYRLQDRDPAFADVDAEIIRTMRQQGRLLCGLPGGVRAGKNSNGQEGKPCG
jgi:3-hydroxyacyl-[acyl-carrier-protein] dehydratase